MFYTYLHRRSDTGQVFYVGKGKGGRSSSRSGRNRRWNFVASKHGYSAEVCATWESEGDAFEHERLLIQVFRDLGHPLVNMTDGGDGVSGYKHTAAQVESLRRRLIDYYRANPEARKRISEKVRAARLGESVARQRLEVSRHQPTVVDRMTRSQASAEKWRNPATRQKFIRARIAQFSTQSGRDAMAIAHGAKPFRCIETGEIFYSKSEAARRLGTHPANVSRVLDKKNSHANGHHLEWVMDQKELNPRPAMEGTV